MTRRLADQRSEADQAGAVPPDRLNSEAAARELVLRRLTQGPRTRAQLVRVLAARGFAEATITRVLDRFSEVGLIDDEAFAQAWVESRHAGRGLARRALAHELRARGVAEETVDHAVAQLTRDQEEETARILVRRRLQSGTGETRDVRVRRAAGALARKGYSGALAFRLIREELEREGGSTEGFVEPAESVEELA
jgi:regulatory protein